MTLIERLLAQANKEANELADLLNEAAQALAQPQQEPVFWYRPVMNGEMYEGPVYNNSISGKMLRDENPTEWVPLYTSPPAREPMTHADLDLCRQWFGCIQDTNPSYIGRNDCALAAKLYTRLGLPIPKELQGVSARGIKETK